MNQRIKDIKLKGHHINLGEEVLLNADADLSWVETCESMGLNPKDPGNVQAVNMHCAALSIIRREVIHAPVDSVTLNVALRYILLTLNEAFEADPAAIDALIWNRVPCNQALADHPHIIVDESPLSETNIHGRKHYFERKKFTVGMLGILAGISERITGKRIAVKFVGHDRPKLLGFCVFEPPKEEKKA